MTKTINPSNILLTLISTLNATHMSLNSLLFYYGIISSNTFINSMYINQTYFILDTLQLIYNHKTNKIAKEMIFHHSISIVTITYILTYTPEKFYNLIACGFLAEVSTIPLNIAWTLNEIEKTDNNLYKLSSLSTIILYIPFRLINLPYISITLFKHKMYYLTFIALNISGLNYYWFYKLIKKAKRD